VAFCRKNKGPYLGYVAAKQDSLTALEPIRKRVEKIRDCELIVVDCNHFEPYVGKHFEVFAQTQAFFLAKHLLR